MVGAVIPLFLDILPQLEQSSGGVNTGVVDVTHEVDLGRSARETLKQHFEFELGILEDPETHEDYAMPH